MWHRLKRLLSVTCLVLSLFRAMCDTLLLDGVVTQDFAFIRLCDADLIEFFSPLYSVLKKV